jgi:cob(I)alamin adenosyltransferase
VAHRFTSYSYWFIYHDALVGKVIMVQLTRIYTRGGDKGKTSLGSGKRIFKSDARIHAIGDVDEANAAIGWARQYAPPPLDSLLMRLQNDLFPTHCALFHPKLITSNKK